MTDNSRIEEIREITKAYTLDEVAEALGVTRRTLMRYLAEGKLQGAKIGGKWRFSPDNLKAFLNNR